MTTARTNAAPLPPNVGAPEGSAAVIRTIAAPVARFFVGCDLAVFFRVRKAGLAAGDRLIG
jgi:hypothetical protein